MSSDMGHCGYHLVLVRGWPILITFNQVLLIWVNCVESWNKVIWLALWIFCGALSNNPCGE